MKVNVISWYLSTSITDRNKLSDCFHEACHCREENTKWVSLLLWAGADPYARGDDGTGEPDPEEQNSAIELAALYDRFDLFKLKNMRLDPKHPLAYSILQSACRSRKPEILKKLLESGFDPSNSEDQGSSLISPLISGIWGISPYYGYKREKIDIDHSGARDKLKMIHMVVRYGGKWQPGREDINRTRRTLLKMRSDYTMEFIWILAEYGACSLEVVDDLICGPKMRKLLSGYASRLQEIKKIF